jgi:hypothetical protein
MWILFKLIIALIGFVIRWSRISFRKPHGTIDGSPYFLVVEKTKSGTVTDTKIGVPFSFSALFSFHFEDGQDAFWKKLGLSHEFQTGDQEFDRKIYIASDNSGLHQILEDVPEVRKSIVETLGGKDPIWKECRLRFDGSKLWYQVPGLVADVEGVVRNLIRLKTQLLSARDSVTAFWKDRFFLRCLLVESTIWALAAYSWGSFIDLTYHSEDQHLRVTRLVLYSGFTAAAMIALLLVAVTTLIRGSSRAHRVILESKFLLVFSVPLAAFSGFSDLNRSLDTGPSIVEKLRVQRVEERRHRRRRGGVHYTYHAYLIPQNGTASVAVRDGRWIQITSDRYRAAVSAKQAVMEIGPGRFGVPWIRELSFE